VLLLFIASWAIVAGVLQTKQAMAERLAKARAA